jgi:hypothetical protein
LEELAVQIGQAVSRSMMDQALAGQAQAVPAAAQALGSAAPGPSRSPRRTTGRHHHGGDGPLDRAQTVLPPMSGRFFSLSPSLGIDQLVQPSCPAADRLRRGPEHRLRPAGTICGIWLA